MYDILSLGEMVLPELREIADKFDLKHKGVKKQDLIYKILDYQAVNPDKFKNVGDVKPPKENKKPVRTRKTAENKTEAKPSEDRKKRP
jgi:transcription termination factor Rho